MRAIIGIDVGTTETKCCLIQNNNILFEERVATQYTLIKNTYEIEPYKIWMQVKQLIKDAVSYSKTFDEYIISVVCQAPTICMWNTQEEVYGISYLAYYGDATKNSKEERKQKFNLRYESLKKNETHTQKNILSGLTGYIIYKLTGKVSMDSVTAWELGIESLQDVEEAKKICYPNILAKIYAPLDTFRLDTEALEKNIEGTVLVGTTDSAVLPLSIVPSFCDYYIYLGTWGSLLKSKIENSESYNVRLWNGHLHEWIVSIPDFQIKCKDESYIEEFIWNISKHIKNDSRVAISGGLLHTHFLEVSKQVNKYLNKVKTFWTPKLSTAYGAAKLGCILERGNE